ncbi:MAG: hypothetical protein U9R19_04560, partial [Bacteroidota bacterium]|nr:hypothetical protein [Bacteroidota bacterium]
MKAILKSILAFFVTSFLIATTAIFVYAQPGPISAPAGTSMIPSDYVDATIPDDPVFIFCSPDANGDSLLGTLSVSGGLANSEYTWGLYDPDPGVPAGSNPNYQTFVAFDWQNGSSSTIDSLQSGFYQVVITNNPGAPNEATFCRRAHVFVNQTILEFDSIAAGCQPFTLTGGVIDALNDFTIYDPPPTPFVVDSTTEITVCFWADHTFVSDLGFYLIGPGGNRVDLLPPVSAWDQGAQVTTLDISVVTDCDPLDYYTNCNSGNHIDNFCFTSALPTGDPTETPCICDMTTPLTGTFASCDAWDDIYGNMASQVGWQVMIYDCTPADIGSLQKVTITFTGQSECGLTTYEYNSGPINVTINDAACDPTTAATYTVPLKGTSQHTITNEVTAEWSSFPVPWDAAWGVQDFNINTTPIIDPEPTQSTTFFLTVYDHLYDTLGNEITISNFPYYNACEPVVSQYFETLPTDATILTYPTYICETDPPIQLIPLNYGGTWSSSTCGSYSTGGCLTAAGGFFPSLALLGDNLITYEFFGVCADQQTVIINVVDAPVVSNIEEHCNGSNTQFYVTFTVIDGNPGAYSFLNASDSSLAGGSILGSTWTGPWLPSPSNYSYIVTDNNDCDPSIVTGYHNCQCTSDAGIMSTSQLELCAFDQVVVEVQTDAQNNPTYNLDANDGFEYFLHDNQFSFLGNVINHNTTGIFLFQPPMVYGQLYYISHVVGNNIGTPTDHVVDISDDCLSVSQGTPVVWYEFPTSNAGLDDFICGNTIQLDADTAAIGIGTWSCMTATGTIYGPNFNDPKVTVTVPYFDTNQYGCLMNTDFVYRWTVKNGPCEIFDDVTVELKPQPVAFAGDDYSICGMDAELQAQFSSLCGPLGSSEGEWFGPGQISGPLTPITDVTVFGPGSYTWIWREFNDECWDEDFV